jgi:hypothetical protein
MSNVLNWKKIAGFAAALFLAEVLVGFIDGGTASSVDLGAAKQRLTLSTLLSLFFSAVIFSVMAVRQDYRPFLHAGLALLFAFAFSLALGAILPAWLTDTPLILVALDWLTLAVGLIIGTSIGHHVLRRFRADA